MAASLPTLDEIRAAVREEIARALEAAKPTEWLSTGEAMKRTGLSESTVRRLVRSREWRSTKVRGKILIDSASLPRPEAEVVDLAARARGR